MCRKHLAIIQCLSAMGLFHLGTAPANAGLEQYP